MTFPDLSRTISFVSIMTSFRSTSCARNRLKSDPNGWVDVAWLEVAVNDLAAVCALERAGDLDAAAQDLLEWQRTVVETIHQCRAFAQCVV